MVRDDSSRKDRDNTLNEGFPRVRCRGHLVTESDGYGNEMDREMAMRDARLVEWIAGITLDASSPEWVTDGIKTR